MRDFKMQRHGQDVVHTYTRDHSLQEFLRVTQAQTVKVWDADGNATVWHILND